MSRSAAAQPTPRPAGATEDVRVQLNQSFATKLVDGLKWPIQIESDEKNFSSSDLATAAVTESLSISEINNLAHDVYSPVSTLKKSDDDDYNAIRKILDTVRSDIRKVINRLEAGKATDSDITLEEAKLALAIFEGRATAAEVTAAKGLCLGLDFKVKKARVLVDQPGVNIGNGRFTFDIPRVSVKVWIDVIAEYPGLCCRDNWCGCFCPKACCKTKSWELRPSASFKAAGYAYPVSTKDSVLVKGHFTNLRFKHPLLGWIPLENFVNKSLDKKPLTEIPYEKFKQSFPDLNANVEIEYIHFHNTQGSIPMSATINVTGK